MKEFELRFYEKRGYPDAKIVYEMTELKTNDPVEISDILYEQEPRVVLEIQTEKVEGHIATAKARLLDDFLKADDFKTVIEQPITVKAKLKPKKAGEKDSRVLETLKLKVAPNATLRWEVVEPEFRDGDRIYFPEYNGPQWLTLGVWLEEWLPDRKILGRKTVPYEFTHYLLPLNLPVESAAYFGERDISRPGPHAATEWGRNDPFSEDTRPAQVANGIRVRAWPPGSVLEHKDPPKLSGNAKPIKLANPDSLEGMKIELTMEPKNLKAGAPDAVPRNPKEKPGMPIQASEENSQDGVDISLGVQNFSGSGP